MTRWFRMYDEAVNDPKVQKLPAVLFKVWVNLLCIASKNDGALPPIDDVAFALRTDEAAATDWIDALVSHGLIDNIEEIFVMHNWAVRQCKSDHDATAADRQRRKRAADKAKRDTRATPEDHARVTRDITEESRRQNRTEQSRTDISSPPAAERSFSKIDLKALADEFYRAYPKKVEGKPAREKFVRLVKAGADPQALIAAARRYAEACRRAGTDKQYIKSPLVWLNKGCWDDEDLPTPVRKPGQPAPFVPSDRKDRTPPPPVVPIDPERRSKIAGLMKTLSGKVQMASQLENARPPPASDDPAAMYVALGGNLASTAS